MFRLFKQPNSDAAVQPLDQQNIPPLQPAQPGLAFAGHLQVPATAVTDHSPYVSRKPRRIGKILYSYGAQHMQAFKMIATGQVASSGFQPWFQGKIFNAEWNGALHEAGYPINQGLTTKVHTPPDIGLQGGAQPTMGAQPRLTESVFTRRRFAGAPVVPAKPAQS